MHQSLVEYHGGIHIPGTPLWMDATRPRELCFISHAHSDHVARHDKIIATPPTARLYRHRFGKVGDALISPFNRPFTLGKLRMELFRAGHCLGAAQLDIEMDGLHIVYTGDFSLADGLTVEGAQIKQCDILIIEATYGDPRYCFPERQKVCESILLAVEDVLSSDGVPCFFSYPLGRSQELIMLLTQAGHKVRVHSSIYATSQIYRQFGVDLGRFEQYYRRPLAGEVLIFPTSAVSWEGVKRLRGLVSFAVTGWAIEDGYAGKFGIDQAFPLSDHADFNDLVTYVEQARPREVYTIFGHHETLARQLRERKFNATPLDPPLQLDLFK